ncbi:hypothetical protein [Nocardia rhizosphaerae]|uniref:Uncharacterized protein n=1 Tax=Nocardia rhizosphaerae TaxID=1691571 RepID=A0ABV8LBR5_9NOCA
MVDRDMIAQLRQDITTAGDAGDEATVRRLRGELSEALRDGDDETGAAAIVTEADLRELLAVTSPDARLVMSQGRLGVHTGPGDGDGLLVITRADLVHRVGGQSDARGLAELAALLDTDIRLLGA